MNFDLFLLGIECGGHPLNVNNIETTHLDHGLTAESDATKNGLQHELVGHQACSIFKVM
jgi:hypothetical protein